MNAEGFCSDHGIEFEITHRGWANIQCPFCDDRGKHCGLPLEGVVANCWKCGKHGVVEIIRELLSVSWKQARELFEEYGGAVSETEVLEKVPKVANIKLPPRHPTERCPRFLTYLKSRGFDIEYAEGIWGAYYSVHHRIVLPVYAHDNYREIMGYVERQVTRKGKYRGPTGWNTKDHLYGHHHIGFQDGWNAVNVGFVVEGPFDAWRMGAGRAVATFGTSWSKRQVVLLKNSPVKKWVVMFDPEEEAQFLAQSLVDNLLVLGKEAYLAEELPDGKDPAELTFFEADALAEKWNRRLA